MYQVARMCQMNKTAIVGGTGNLGKELAKHLPEAVCFGRGLDLSSRDNTHRLLDGYSTCIFLAADPRLYYYQSRPHECIENNYSLVRNVADIGFKRIIFASSVGVYKDSQRLEDISQTGWNEESKFYGMAKLLGEKHLELLCTDAIVSILRFSTFWSPLISKGPLFDLAVNRVSYVNMKSKYSFLHTSDASKAIVCCLEAKESAVYNVTADRSTRLSEISGIPADILSLGDTLYSYGSDTKNRPPGWAPTINVNNLSYGDIKEIYECRTIDQL